MGQPIKIKGDADLSSGALNVSVAYDIPLKLCQVLLHSSVNITETVQVKFDSGDGSNYDTILDSHDLSTESNYVFRPTGECKILRGDKFVVACTNANGTGHVYATIICEPA